MVSVTHEGFPETLRSGNANLSEKQNSVPSSSLGKKSSRDSSEIRIDCGLVFQSDLAIPESGKELSAVGPQVADLLSLSLSLL